MKSLILLAFLTVRLVSAAPGEVFITPDNTGTNAFPASVSTNLVILLVSTADDGRPFVTVDGVIAHTTGNIFEVNNGTDHYFTIDASALIAFGLAGTNNGTLTTAANGTIQMNSARATGNLFVINTNVAVLRADGQLDFKGGASGTYAESVSGNAFADYQIDGFDVFDETTTQRILGHPDVPDGQLPFLFDTSLAHTLGNLFQINNYGAFAHGFGFDGGSIQSSGAVTNTIAMGVDSGNGMLTQTIANSSGNLFLHIVDGVAHVQNMYASGGSVHSLFLANNTGYDSMVVGGQNAYALSPNAADGNPAYQFHMMNAHTSGNVFEFLDPLNNPLCYADYLGNLTAAGKASAPLGFSSTASDAAVTIASTGWTNTFAKNASVYLDGIGLTFKVANASGTFVYTNSVALAGDTVLLQPGGKVIITAGTLSNGRAAPF